MANREQFVRKLYPVFSANLALYYPEFVDHFLCPICFRLFEDIETAIPELSEAHIIPRMWGGKDATLTCERCNNTIGTRIEGEEAKRLKEFRQIEGKHGLGVPLKMRFGAEGTSLSPINVYLSKRRDGEDEWLNIHIDADQNHPKNAEQALDLIRDALELGKHPLQVSMPTGNRYEGRVADLTYLSVAYLRLFHELGYEWVFTPVASEIRKQLMEPTEKLIEPWVFGSKQKIDLSDAFVLVKAPDEFRGFAIFVGPLERDPDATMIWIPAFHTPYPAGRGEEMQRANITFDAVASYHDGLDNPRSKFYWHRKLYPGATIMLPKPMKLTDKEVS